MRGRRRCPALTRKKKSCRYTTGPDPRTGTNNENDNETVKDQREPPVTKHSRRWRAAVAKQREPPVTKHSRRWRAAVAARTVVTLYE